MRENEEQDMSEKTHPDPYDMAAAAWPDDQTYGRSRERGIYASGVEAERARWIGLLSEIVAKHSATVDALDDASGFAIGSVLCDLQPMLSEEK